MASKGKESVNVKERRGLSPSNPPRQAGTTPTQRKRSPNPSPVGGGSTTDQKRASASAERSVPNYLRATASSGVDQTPSTPGKKPAPNANTSQKPILQRRRSFDKPPSPSGPRKPLAPSGPGARNVQPASPSPRATATMTPKIHSERFHSERLSRAPKEFGKSHSLGARTVGARKSPSTAEKHISPASTTAAATAKPPTPTVIAEVSHVTDHPAPEPQQEDQESSIPEAEEEVVKVVESHDELPKLAKLPTVIPVVEEKKHVEHVQAEPVIEKVEEHKARESPKVPEDHIATPAAQIEEEPLNEAAHVEEISISHDVEEEDISKDVSEIIHHEEDISSESKVEVEKEVGEEAAIENAKGKELEEKEADGVGSQVVKPKEREGSSEGGAEELKRVAENGLTRHQTVQPKKDTQAYNDVIEETASKLLEKRKNKVRALVGAFETVISLQEPEA